MGPKGEAEGRGDPVNLSSSDPVLLRTSGLPSLAYLSELRTSAGVAALAARDAVLLGRARERGPELLFGWVLILGILR